MASKQYYVDTNVLVAMLERDDERAHELLDLFDSAPADTETFITSELTLAELLVLPYRESDASLVSSYMRWFSPGSLLGARSVNRQILVAAAALRAANAALRLPDAIHLATAFSNRCAGFLTLDIRLGRSVPQTDSDAISMDVVELDSASIKGLIAEFSS